VSKYDKQYYVDRLDTFTWGKVIEDDKYYNDNDLYDSFFCFTHYAFAYLKLPSPTRAQIEIADFVSDTANPHRMVMCLRGLSKSLHSELYVVWRLLNDPNEKILVMSAGATRAVSFTQFVQKLLKLLPVCNGMQPRHNKERTSSQAFDVAGADPSDSPSMYAVGAGNQVTGMRATLVIYDDIETPQNAGSVVLREKLDHYASEATNLLMTGRDESITLCTPHSVDSIYTDWIQNRGFKPLIIPAEYPSDLSTYGDGLAPYIVERLKANPSLIGSNIDERFTMEVLHSKAQRIGKSQYKLQYMLDVTESDELKHPLKLSDLIVMDVDIDHAPTKVSPSSMRENIVNVRHNGFRNDRLYSPSFTSDARTDYNYRVMSLDPNGRGSDESGIAVGFSVAGKIYIKKVSGMNGGYEYDTLLLIAQMCSDYNIDYLVVESNFGDGAIAKMLEPILMKVSPNTEIVEVRAKMQKEVRIITTLEPLMNQHKIIVDKKIFDDELTSDSVIQTFSYQLSHLSKLSGCLKHDDRIDALEILCRFIVERDNFDEEYADTKIAQDKLESDLAEMLSAFGMYQQNTNYADVF
jgi:hypothetical protein